MQLFRELDGHPDLQREILKRTSQNMVASVEEGGGILAEEVMTHLLDAMEGPRAEPAVWNASLDRPLFPEDPSA
jgi:hypothetical protein